MAKKWFYSAKEVEAMQMVDAARAYEEQAQMKAAHIKAMAELEAKHSKTTDILSTSIKILEQSNELAIVKAVKAKEDELKAGLIEASEKAAVAEALQSCADRARRDAEYKLDSLATEYQTAIALIMELAKESKKVQVVEGAKPGTMVVVQDGKQIEIVK